MELDISSYNPSFCPIQTRKLIIQKWLNGEAIKDIAIRYDLTEDTIKSYIRRYKKTGDVLSDYEIKKKYGTVEREKIFNNTELDIFTSNDCITTGADIQELIYPLSSIQVIQLLQMIVHPM